MENARIKTLLGDIGAIVGFYTRFPPPWSPEPDRHFSEAQWAAPIAGLVVAFLAALAFGIALRAGLPAGVAAALALGAAMLATGCLHEDGLADVADGFGGGKTAGEKLAIMRDSRIGTYGVLALVLALLVKWAALSTLTSFAAALLALLAAHAASRALMPAFMHSVARARDDGLSAEVGHVEAGPALAALVLGFVALFFIGFGPALIAVALLALWFLVLKLIAERHIGGQTGDVLGTLQQGGEIIVLAIACATLS